MTLSPDNAIRILHWLRVAAIAGQVAAIAAARWLLEDDWDPRPLLAVTLSFALWHLGLLRRYREGRVLDERRLALETCIDVVAITALLCLAGGWTNPFASIYLVPLGFAAATLPLRTSSLVVAVGLVAYLVTIAFYVPLPDLEPRHGDHQNLHLIGMWISFVLAGSLLVGTVSLVRRAYDAERSALAHERESRLRDEQVLSLGVLAASTAHELGTPLSTARLIAEEMQRDPAGIVARDVEILGQQLDYAVGQLRRLVALADHGGEEDVPVDELCARIVDRFRILRPDVELVEIRADETCATVSSGGPLESAILSLLLNAAHASVGANRPRVEFSSTFESGEVVLKIRDYGAGFVASGASHGERSSNGMGVGLVISSATLERHGAEARHFRREPGTEVVVSLPVSMAGIP